jgi:hypothetical protein
MKIPTKIRKLLEPCKHVDAHTKKLFLPLVSLAVKQHDEIRQLEEKLRSLQEPKLFTPPPPPVKKDPPPPPKPLGEWLKEQFDHGLENTEDFKRFLRWKKLDIEQARKMAFDQKNPLTP